VAPTIRSNIKPGIRVLIVLKEDRGTGNTTEGVVTDILTNSPTHPHGIKVRREGGQTGRKGEADFGVTPQWQHAETTRNPLIEGCRPPKLQPSRDHRLSLPPPRILGRDSVFSAEGVHVVKAKGLVPTRTSYHALGKTGCWNARSAARAKRCSTA